MSLTSIVILTLNNFPKTKACIDSIYRFTNQPYELIIVDNGSTDETLKYLKKLSDIKLICNKQNKGFAAGCNQGMKIAKGTQILLLNNDTIVSHNWLFNLLQALNSDSQVGMVGPLSNMTLPKQLYQVNYSNGTEYHEFALKHNIHDTSKWKPATILSGFCLLFKRKVMEQIGEMDEQYMIGNYEDADYCYRASRCGFRLLIAGDTFVHHDGNSTFKDSELNIISISNENRAKFIKKWGIDANELI